MRKSIAITALAALVLVPSATSGQGIRGIAEFRETTTSYTIEGSGAGRVEVWRTRVYTLKGKFVGTGVTACIYPDNLTSLRQCAATYRLPLGKVFTFGTIFTRVAFKVAIFQGTDFYSNAEGTCIIRKYASRPTQSWLTFYFT